jgi:tripeptide aminopeptidase
MPARVTQYPDKSPPATKDLLKAHSKAIDLVLELMAIPGASGNEANVAQFVVEELKKAGAPGKSIRVDRAHTRTQLHGNTGNVILKLHKPGGGATRLLSAHMDTVPICVGSKPVRRGTIVTSANKATGLGADDRAGVAVLLHTACGILRERPDVGDLTFLWTVQEEVGLEGARHLIPDQLGRPYCCFNWDGGSAERITIGATGAYRMRITVFGLASHAGGHPEQGISATAIAGLAIADLQKSGWHGLVRKGRNLGTSNVGVIAGGTATNVVTDQVTIRAEARSHDPDFRREIVRQFELAFEKAVKSVRNAAGELGRVEFEVRAEYESYLLEGDDPSIEAARDAIAALGLAPELVVSNGGLDTNWLYAHGHPGVTLGCGQRNIHTTKEELDLVEFSRACEIAWRLATQPGL